MTREEAIKNIKRLIGFSETLDESISTLFPELKESEDEKIRKDLIKYLESDRDCQPCQDVSFYDSSIAWLEKQKESPKSADSIPSDCASDAKCEDRWHKVGDSLPDNGRLVLANDCLGNTLLARYDGEGNWEVSVYDNDDYYCQNTITKWCEIPSEKQKEPTKEELYAETGTTEKEYIANTMKMVRAMREKQKEQKPVDLEKEYKEYVEDDPVFSKLTNRIVGLAIARHFYELSKKEVVNDKARIFGKGYKG